MTPTIKFDEASHTYRLNNRVVPHITGIIGRVVPMFKADPWYMERGTAFHKGVELALTGQLDRASVDPRIAGRIEAACRFVSDLKLQVTALEVKLASDRYNFAGRIDGVFLHQKGWYAGIDWKGTLEPAVELQLGAGSILWKENKGFQLGRVAAVECHDDSTYRCWWGSRFPKAQNCQFDLRLAENSFLHALSHSAWLDRNYPKNEEK